MTAFISCGLGLPSLPQNSLIISILASLKSFLPKLSMNCFIYAGSGIPPSPQHCFIISSIFIGSLLRHLDGRVMRLGTDWPSNETEAHHLSLFVEMGQGFHRVRGSAADGESSR